MIQLSDEAKSARAKDDDECLGEMLQEAYKNGQLNRRQVIETKRLIEKRQAIGGGRQRLRGNAVTHATAGATRRLRHCTGFSTVRATSLTPLPWS